MRMPRLAAAAAATTLLLAGAGSASAAPAFAEIIELHCDDGNHYEIWTNGAGAFTPGHVVGTTRMLVPVLFSDNSFTVVTPDKETLVFDDPTVEGKGKGRVVDNVRRDLLYCTYSSTFPLEVEEVFEGELLPAGSMVTFSGAVTAFLTGRG